MLKSPLKTALLSIALTVTSAVSSFAADGAAILRQVDAIRAPGDNFSFNASVKGSDGTSMQFEVAVKDRSKGLVRYLKPKKTSGRSILFVGRNMWVYIPGSRRPLRISPQQQLLGGVSSADVARTVYSDDYSVIGMEGSGGGQVLHLKAASKAAAYGRIDLTVNKRSEPQMAVFYASNGKRKLKTVYFEGYKNVLGAKRPTRLKVIDHLAGNAVTTMTYTSYRMADTPDAWFQPSYLSRL